MMLQITSNEATWFLPFVLPIAIWVAFTDLKYMKIRNKAVLALIAVFVIVGAFTLPLADVGWRMLHLVVVLVITFLMSALGAIGAGDAKYVSAMAPFFVLGDVAWVFLNFALILILSFAAHRLVRKIPLVRRLTPDWESWENRQFPMGLALSVLIVSYLVKGILSGSPA